VQAHRLHANKQDLPCNEPRAHTSHEQPKLFAWLSMLAASKHVRRLGRCFVAHAHHKGAVHHLLVQPQLRLCHAGVQDDFLLLGQRDLRRGGAHIGAPSQLVGGPSQACTDAPGPCAADALLHTSALPSMDALEPTPSFAQAHSGRRADALLHTSALPSMDALEPTPSFAQAHLGLRPPSHRRIRADALLCKDALGPTP